VSRHPVVLAISAWPTRPSSANRQWRLQRDPFALGVLLSLSLIISGVASSTEHSTSSASSPDNDPRVDAAHHLLCRHQCRPLFSSLICGYSASLAGAGFGAAGVGMLAGRHVHQRPEIPARHADHAI